ncbi:unnamed protein product [Linum trigynum]|uniref:Retrotransposable element Tf2 n=1 Tax=Linum trigynum TaxID=586398 RepID=A0AAV2E7D1_9ROSI
MLRAVIKNNIKTWQDVLPHVEFAYNRVVHSTTKHSPFKLMYGFNPLNPLDFTSLPLKEQVNMDGAKKAQFVKTLHEKTRLNIDRRTKQMMKHTNKGRKPRSFEAGDCVWMHIRKDIEGDLHHDRGGAILEDARSLPSSFSRVSYCFVSCQLNRVAHHVAQKALSSRVRLPCISFFMCVCFFNY